MNRIVPKQEFALARFDRSFVDRRELDPDLRPVIFVLLAQFLRLDRYLPHNLLVPHRHTPSPIIPHNPSDRSSTYGEEL